MAYVMHFPEAGALIKHELVFDCSSKSSMCQLTIFSPERSLDECIAALTSVTSILAKIKHTFLVHFAGIGSVENISKKTALPGNVELIVGEKNADGRLRYKGEYFNVGWQLLESHSPLRGQLPPTEAGIIRVLRLVQRNADLFEVVQALKMDPALQYNLLRHMKTVCVALSDCGLKSFEHATLVLGYHQLSQWLSMALLHSGLEPQMPDIYRVSLARAKQMELLAGMCGIPDTEHDAIFVTGVLSLVDRMQVASMTNALEPLLLNVNIRDALERESGPYAPLLKFVRARETGTEGDLYAQLNELGISSQEANLAMARGMYFAATAAHLE